MRKITVRLPTLFVIEPYKYYIAYEHRGEFSLDQFLKLPKGQSLLPSTRADIALKLYNHLKTKFFDPECVRGFETISLTR